MAPRAPHRDAGPTAEEFDTYIRGQAATGDYPHLAEFVARTGTKDMSLGVKAEKFEIGLEWLLAGVEAEVAAAPADQG